MTPDTPSTLAGEVVELADSGAYVRLDDGRRGLLPKGEADVRVGTRGMFSLERTGESGALILSLSTSPPADASPHSFDREFDRLHDALANHSPQPIRPKADTDALGEKQIVEWTERVNKTIASVRKRRAKRLNNQT